MLTVKEIANSYAVAHNTARSDLKKMVELKLFDEAKDRKTILCFAPGDLGARLKPKNLG